MIAKKNPGLNLEGKRTVLFSLGLLTMGAATLAAFTYHSEYGSELDKRKIVAVPIDYLVEERDPVILEKQQEPRTEQNQNDNAIVTLNDPAVISVVLDADVKVTDNDPDKKLKAGIILGAPKVNIGIIGTQKIYREPVDFPEKEAEYLGGFAEMQKFIFENVKYPELENELRIEGVVYVSFVVEKDGSISNVAIEKSVSDGIDREAERVVKKFPKWIPGQVQAENVATRVRLPFRFSLK
jgi:protein TonB